MLKKIFRAMYYVLVALSVVILLLFAAYKLLVRPPEIPASSDLSQPDSSSSTVDSSSQTGPVVGTSDSRARKPGCYTFLLVGADGSNTLADVIMVLTYDTEQQRVGMISIPRDTLVDPKGPCRFPKINNALKYGVETLRGVVSELLGIPIDFTLFVNMEGFVEIIDSIGGIEFDIPVHMNYDDPVQDLHIHYEPGLRTLSGQEALEVCRLRYNDDGTLAYPDYDIGRTQTQRNLLLAVAKKVLKHPEEGLGYLQVWFRHVETDLSFPDLLWFAQQATGFTFDETSFDSRSLPGNGETTCGSIRYCYGLYPDQVLEIVNQVVNPYEEDLTMEDLSIYQVS